MADKKLGINSKSALQQAEQSEIHIKRIRQMLQSDDKETKEDIPA